MFYLPKVFLWAECNCLERISDESVEQLDCYAAACEYLLIPKYEERYLDTEVTLNDITMHMQNLKKKWINGWRG